MSAPGRGGDFPRRGSGAPASSSASPDEEPERVVIRDKRRLDPRTGEPRVVPDLDVSDPLGAALGAVDPPAPEVDDVVAVGRIVELETEVAELTGQVQRVSADFANYRRRMERDREVVAQAAVANTVAALLPVLDDVERARSHGDLTGAFRAVADGLDAVLAKAGLVSFGEVGDAFDPAVHEAVTHDTSPDVERPTTTVIMRRGYTLGDRLVRPAMVGVTDPE